MATMRFYDVTRDAFRDWTQEDLDAIQRIAILQSQFIVSKGLRDEWHAYRAEHEKEAV